jgi:hypothetical protein
MTNLLLISATLAIAGLLLACLVAAAIPDMKRWIFDALHRRRMNRLRATLDREERRHQEADGRDGEEGA